jgi:hypothetical protein
VGLLRALHIEGLPLTMTASKLSELMTAYGPVQYAEVRRDRRQRLWLLLTLLGGFLRDAALQALLRPQLRMLRRACDALDFQKSGGSPGTPPRMQRRPLLRRLRPRWPRTRGAP